MVIKKLIYVFLLLEKINVESIRDKTLQHGHPSTLHFNLALRPLSVASRNVTTASRLRPMMCRPASRRRVAKTAPRRATQLLITH
ncbi:MAG: DUF1156 domain-containing protein, partial [Lentisphaeria bacterium]|nr:DUF1156 domain-containing protein [Lentisphaeria bacterium]